MTSDTVSERALIYKGDGLCPVCEYPASDCVCCQECGHACPLDAGQTYCPVCSPAGGPPD